MEDSDGMEAEEGEDERDQEGFSLEAEVEQETKVEGVGGDSRLEPDELEMREGGGEIDDTGVGIEETNMSALEMSDLARPSRPSKESILERNNRERKGIYSSPPSRPSTTPARPHTVSPDPPLKNPATLKQIR